MKLQVSGNNHRLTGFALLIILSLLFSVSCDKFLPEYENNLELIDTPEDCILTLTGAWTKITGAMHYHNILTVKSEDINLIQAYSECYQNNVLNVNVADEFYRGMYTGIIMCNRIFYDIENYDISSNLEQYLGEAYFIRAYAYFKLVRIFGRIPLVTDIDVNYEIPLASFEEIYGLITDDLQKAIDYLPENRVMSRIPYVTPHRGTAKVLLAEVYLTMAGYPLADESKYDLAAETAKDVIENADFYGFGLAEDFAELWSWDSHENPESILLYYTEPQKSDALFTYISEDWWSIKPTTEMTYYKNFPVSYRKEVSLVTRYPMQFRYTIDSTIYYQNQMIKIDPDNPCMLYSKCFGKKQTFNFETNLIRSDLDYVPLYRWPYRDKFWEGKAEPGAIFSTYYHLFRYAQTLLTYAEAKARSGQADDLAYEALNRVRRRANKMDPEAPSDYDIIPGSLDSKAFADTVVKERSWELCHEFEGRWFDIIRLDLLDQVTSERDPDDPEYAGIEELYQGNKYFLPLSDEDLILNPNLNSK